MFLDVFFFNFRPDVTKNSQQQILMSHWNQLHVRYIKCMQITYQGNACLHDVQYWPNYFLELKSTIIKFI